MKYKIILLIIGIFVSIFISEVIVGLYLEWSKVGHLIKYIELGKGNKLDISRRDPYLGWGFKANARDSQITAAGSYVFYSINTQELRDKETPFKKQKGEFRIIALGESNVMGLGINYGKRFTEIIEKALPNVEMVNMGIWGFGLDQSLLQLEREGFKYNPDLVILFIIEDSMDRAKDFIRCGDWKPRFIVNNDKSDLVLQDVEEAKNRFKDRIVKEPKKNEKNNLQKNILKKSNILALVNYILCSRKSAMIKLSNRYMADWASTAKAIEREQRSRDAYDRKDFLRLIFLLLERYKNLCSKQKSELLVVNIDSKRIVYMSDYLSSLNIPYLDLSDILNKASEFNCLRLEGDGHYNEFSHYIIGEYTSTYIADRYRLSRNYITKK